MKPSVVLVCPAFAPPSAGCRYGGTSTAALTLTCVSPQKCDAMNCEPPKPCGADWHDVEGAGTVPSVDGCQNGALVAPGNGPPSLKMPTGGAGQFAYPPLMLS